MILKEILKLIKNHQLENIIFKKLKNKYNKKFDNLKKESLQKKKRDIFMIKHKL